MAIQFVGYSTISAAGTGTLTASLTALTGGISATAAAGDLVLAFIGWGSNFNGTPTITSPASITLLTDLYSNDSNDANLGGGYFFVSSETSVTSNKGGAGFGSVLIVQVWRGVSTTSPFDVAYTTATNTGSGGINPAAITPVSDSSTIIACGLVATDTSVAAITGPSGFTSGGSDQQASSTASAQMKVAYLLNQPAGVAVNPGLMDTTAGGSGASGAAYTIALRTALGNIKYWNGTSWVAKPVKYWNGTSWVAKPVKYWNGTSWVVTPY